MQIYNIDYQISCRLCRRLVLRGLHCVPAAPRRAALVLEALLLERSPADDGLPEAYAETRSPFRSHLILSLLLFSPLPNLLRYFAVCSARGSSSIAHCSTLFTWFPVPFDHWRELWIVNWTEPKLNWMVLWWHNALYDVIVWECVNTEPFVHRVSFRVCFELISSDKLGSHCLFSVFISSSH